MYAARHFAPQQFANNFDRSRFNLVQQWTYDITWIDGSKFEHVARW
jgi:hypothetical protein